MAPRFTLIQGGLSEQAEPAELRTGHAGDWAAGRQIDLRRLGGGGAEAVSVGPTMRVWNAVNDPLPDHRPPLAQHRPAGYRVALALAWNRDSKVGSEAWQGADPWAMPHPVLGGRAHPRQTAESEAVNLVAQAAAEAVDRALKARLRALRRPIRLVGAAEPARVSSPIRSALATNRSARLHGVPATDIIGIRPEGWEAPAAEIRPVTEPAALRGADETSLVRVASRLFGRRGALRGEFLRRAGEIVAVVRHLRSGLRSVPWQRARA